MEVGVARIFDDQDFVRFKDLINNDEGWSSDYDKNCIQVLTKAVDNSTFKMVKIRTTFHEVCPQDLYDVLHDPEYRKIWDPHVIESIDIGYLNPNNDVGYYAVSCPPPLKNRDFVFQRSWLDTGQEQMIVNHSVYHKDFPPRKGFIRAISYITGYFIFQPKTPVGCKFAYVTRTDPQGTIPAWIVNKCTQIFAPKYIKQIEKAVIAYPRWKSFHNPNLKPWIYPEQITIPKISVDDCVPSDLEIKNNPQLKFPKYQRKSVHSAKEGRRSIDEPSGSKSKSPDSSVVFRTNSLPKEISRSSLNSITSLSVDKKSNSVQANLEKSQEISKKSPKRNRYFSCLDFTKRCTKRSNSEHVLSPDL